MNFKAAGILFHNQHVVLLGKKAYGRLRNKFSGFGGSLHRGEKPAHGAVREVLEEIYGIIPANTDIDIELLINKILRTIPPRRSHFRDGYALYELRFTDLGAISKLVSLAGDEPYFPYGVPMTVEGLTKHFLPSGNSEFKALKLFRKADLSRNKSIDNYVLADLELID